VVQLFAYGLLFGLLHTWLFDRLYPRLTHDVNVERTAFLIRLAMYALFGVAVAACTVLFDYSKVRAVVEDRRSALGALAAALGFLKRHVGAAVGLFLLNFTLFAASVALYGLVAPGAGRADPLGHVMPSPSAMPRSSGSAVGAMSTVPRSSPTNSPASSPPPVSTGTTT